MSRVPGIALSRESIRPHARRCCVACQDAVLIQAANAPNHRTAPPGTRRRLVSLETIEIPCYSACLQRNRHKPSSLHQRRRHSTRPRPRFQSQTFVLRSQQAAPSVGSIVDTCSSAISQHTTYQWGCALHCVSPGDKTALPAAKAGGPHPNEVGARNIVLHVNRVRGYHMARLDGHAPT